MFSRLVELVRNNPHSFFQRLNSREYSDLADWILDETPELSRQDVFKPTWSTRCYWILNGMRDFPVCPTCGKKYGFKNISIGSGYPGHCCNRCKTLDKSVQKKISDTCLDRYGVTWSSKDPANRRKYSETCMERYGAKNTFQVQRFKDTMRNTRIERYGDPEWRNHGKRT